MELYDSFSIIHALAYSFIGAQTLYIATQFNPIYWDTACLIVNSGAINEEAGGSTDYGKVAKAIGDIRSAGIKVSLANINKSDFGFAPDLENNQILFGLKGMLNVGDDVIQKTIANRPYISPRDYLNKVNPNKQAMISLIKGGAFDDMIDRKTCMAWYIWETCNKKAKITLQNMASLIKYNLIPEDEECVLATRVFEFNRYLKAITKQDPARYNDYYTLDMRAIDFLSELGLDNIITTDNLAWFVKKKDWDKEYQNYMNIIRTWLTAERDTVLKELNTIIFKEDWDKYASGSLSTWEMEVLCFYYHDHELIDVNNPKYGFVDFFSLPDEPVVDYTFERGGKTINVFKLNKICGTCIAKDKPKGNVTLLTTSGVVTVKFRKEYFALFDKQISELGADGKKHVVEKSWFNRGNMIVVQGIRSGDNFITKKYASSGGHQLYRINEILPDGDVVLQVERYQGGIAEDVEV